MNFEIGSEVKEFMAETGLREDAVRYATQRPASEWEEIHDGEGVWIIVSHDPEGKRLRLTFNAARDRLLTVRPV